MTSWRQDAFAVADRRQLDRSRFGGAAGDYARARYAGMMDGIDTARHVARAADGLHAWSTGLGAEGIVVTPDEVWTDVLSTDAEMAALHRDFENAYAAGRVSADLLAAWRNFADAWTRYRDGVRARYAQAAQLSSWDPVGRAAFWRDIQAMNTRLEEQKASLRRWAATYQERSGQPTTAPPRERQTPPSEGAASIAPPIAAAASEIGSTVMTGLLIVGAVIAGAFLLARRST